MFRRAVLSREAPVSEKEAPEFALDRHLFFWLTEVLERRDRRLSTALKAGGVRVPEWRVLGSLHGRQRLFQRIWPAVHAVNDAAIAGVSAPAVEMTRWALQRMCRNFDLLDRGSQQERA